MFFRNENGFLPPSFLERGMRAERNRPRTVFLFYCEVGFPPAATDVSCGFFLARQADLSPPSCREGPVPASGTTVLAGSPLR